jgi:hypothetical protein
MPKRQKTSKRTLDYLTLQWMLLLFILGGLVTLNCNPTKEIAGGTLTEKEGVDHNVERNAISFDSAVNNDSAEYTLPATFPIGGKDQPIEWSVDETHVKRGRASMNGNVATINYPSQAEQHIAFWGYYWHDDGNGPVKHKVVHRVTVVRY